MSPPNRDRSAPGAMIDSVVGACGILYDFLGADPNEKRQPAPPPAEDEPGEVLRLTDGCCDTEPAPAFPEHVIETDGTEV